MAPKLHSEFTVGTLYRDRSKPILTIAFAIALSLPSCSRRNPGDEIQPGFNLFSRQQDIELGRQAATEVRKQYQVVNNQELQDYTMRIGARLAAQKEPKESGFPFAYTLVNDKSVNAFALPGGPTFVHTGLILAAADEGQLAGVLAHEMSHVVLRHGTNQASKANLVKIPVLLAAAVTGNDLLVQLTNMGAMGLLLKFSRTSESQADAMGTRIMSEAGYDPTAMAHFFEKLQSEGGSRAPQFLSDHPNPGNRVAAVQEEIKALPRRQYGNPEGDFAHEKALVAKLPRMASQPNALRTGAPPPDPSSRPTGGYKVLKSTQLELSYPDNWIVVGDSKSASFTIAPRDGIVLSTNGQSVLALGAIVSYYFPESQTREDLHQATLELIQHLHGANPQMRTSGTSQGVSVDGNQGLITILTNDSPYQGQSETDMLITVDRLQGLFYMIIVAPQSNVQDAKSTFDTMVRSIRFSG